MKKTLLALLLTLSFLNISCERDNDIIPVQDNNNCNNQKIEKYYHYKTIIVYDDNSQKEYLFDSTSVDNIQTSYFYFDKNYNPIYFDILFKNNIQFHSVYNTSYSDTIFFPPTPAEKTKIWVKNDKSQIYIAAINPGNTNYAYQKKIIFLKKCKI